MQHFISSFTNKNPKPKMEQINAVNPFVFQVCKKDFQSNEYLEIHLHSHLAYHPTKCGFCHFLATNREEMHQHVLSLHAESLSVRTFFFL